ncbi:MAG: cytochrome P460 family protein [Alphaproteobacteria bacterium]|nr:cytochrome P460 family protein [Alphaproteobacteria bacterium]
MRSPSLLMLAGALALSAGSLVGCGDKDGDTGVGDDGDSKDDANLATAQALWTEIDGYEGWSQTADWIGIQPSVDGTHGDYVQIWANTTAYGTITGGGGGDMPDGAVLVKEGYDDETGSTLTGITVMKKVDGFDADNGDWFWAKYQADGTIELYGSVSGCSGCHSSGQDYVQFETW